jgi:hypothetical protein
MSTTLESSQSLTSYLKSLIKETVKSTLHRKALEEKEKQQSSSGPTNDPGNSDEEKGKGTDLFSDSDSGSDSSAPSKPSKSSKTIDDESEKLKGGDISADDIVEKLNSIRGGKSFKDETISGSMDEYVNSLSKAEKVALLSFLKGIAQIVTGEISAEDAAEPDDSPSDVKMKKGPTIQKKSVKPNVIKTAPVKTKSTGSEEDTSAPKATPPPITAKRR